MFELKTFYDFCKENQVAVIPYDGMPKAGATLRDGAKYAIFLDFTKLPTTRQLRGVCCHEMSHVATGALHRAGSPFQSVERSEYRANRYAAQRFLTREKFREAFRAGYTESWQLAEYFDLPEEDIQKALHYWTACRGTNFNQS